MKYIKTYNKYKESLKIDLGLYSIDIMESLNLWHDVILSSIGAEEVDIYDTFNLIKDQNINIDDLSDNVEFMNSLSSIALKKSPIQSSSDFECFINKPCKFMFIYGVESNELETPIYIIFQSWNEALKKWDESKLYKVNDDIKKFYDKLSSKTIEIIDNDQNYIYTTNNAGNEWMLQNNKENDIYKKVFRKDELENFLSSKKVKINVI